MSLFYNILKYLLILLIVVFIPLIKTAPVYANSSCQLTADPSTVKPDFKGNITFTSTNTSCLVQNTSYLIIAHSPKYTLENAFNGCKTGPPPAYCPYTWGLAKADQTDQQGNPMLNVGLNFEFPFLGKFTEEGQDWKVVVCLKGSNDLSDCLKPDFQAGASTIKLSNLAGGPPSDLPTINLEKQTACVFQIPNSSNPVTINEVDNFDPNKKYGWWRYPNDKDIREFNTGNGDTITDLSNNQATASIQITDLFKPGIQQICIDQKDKGTTRSTNVNFINCLWVRFIARPVEPQDQTSCSNLQNIGFNKRCIEANEANKNDPDRCTSGGGKEVTGCTKDPEHPAIATAIGCIHTNLNEFATDMLRFIIGISGGLAFLMMILGAFQMLTSAGNPDTLRAGRERLTSAVIGLLFVIFAVLLLQIISAGILNLPGFK